MAGPLELSLMRIGITKKKILLRRSATEERETSENRLNARYDALVLPCSKVGCPCCICIIYHTPDWIVHVCFFRSEIAGNRVGMRFFWLVCTNLRKLCTQVYFYINLYYYTIFAGDCQCICVKTRIFSDRNVTLYDQKASFDDHKRAVLDLCLQFVHKR